MAAALCAGLLLAPTPVLAQSAEGGVTLAGAPSGTSNQSNPDVQVIAPGKTAYRYSFNGAPYSPERPIDAPIRMTGDIEIGGLSFTAGSSALIDFLKLKTTDLAFTDFLNRITFRQIPSQLQVTYTVNGKRAQVVPDNVLNLRGAGVAGLNASIVEKTPAGPQVELTAISITGGTLAQMPSAPGGRQFVLSIPRAAGEIVVTPFANSYQTAIVVNGAAASAGAAVSIPAPLEGQTVVVQATRPDASEAVYAITIHYDDAMPADEYHAYYLRAFTPSAAYVSIRNAGAAVVTYSLRLNQTFGDTTQDIVREIADMPLAYPGETMPAKVWRFIRDNRYHFEPLTNARWNHSPGLFFNSIGFGYCDDSASLFRHLMTAMGYTARVWELNGHIVAEVLVNNRWEMWDPDLQVAYLNRNGLVAGVEELAADPDLIVHPLITVPGADGAAYDPSLAAIYGSRGDNHVLDWYDWLPDVGDSSMMFQIPPGGTFEFPDVFDAPLAAIYSTQVPSYVNARLTVPEGFSGDLTVPLVIQSIGWSNNPTLQVITTDAAGNWDVQPAVAAWTVDAEAPFTTATQALGVSNASDAVALTASEPATIYYTTDGSEPSEASSVYSTPIAMAAGTWLRFFAVDLVGNREAFKIYGAPVLQLQLAANVSAMAAVFNASASGGSGSYEYMFDITDPFGRTTVVQYHGPSNRWRFNRATALPGTYTVRVCARNRGSSSDCEQSAATTVIVGAEVAPVLVNPGDQTDNTDGLTYADTVMADHPVGYWRLDESGGAFAADMTGAAPASRFGGLAASASAALADGNGATQFNGVDSYVRIANRPALQLAGDVTLEVWLRQSVAMRQTLISKDYSHEFELTVETNGQLNWYQGNGPAVVNVLSLPGAVTPGGWRHVVVTRSASTRTIRFYVDGRPQGTGTYDVDATPGSGSVSIGRSEAVTGYVNGLLDEVAIYPAVLTADRIVRHYAMRLASGQGTPVELPLVATDANGDSLTYAVTGLPPGLAVDSATGMITGVLTRTTPGVFPVLATVSDGVLSHSQPFTWTITHTNVAPRLTAPPPQTYAENASVSLQLSAVDPEGDPLTFSAAGLPASLSIDPLTGVIAGTLPFQSAGSYQPTIAVSDGAAITTAPWTLFVAHTNRPPVLTAPGAQTSALTWSYAATVAADHAIAYWRLGDLAGGSAGESIGSVAGTVLGGVTPGQTGALADGDAAMLFNGSSGYIQAAPVSRSLAGDLTIELWLNVSLASRQTLVSKDPSREFELTLETNGELNFYQGNGVSSENVRSTSGAVTANSWQHIVVTRSAATKTIAFVVNGVLRGSVSYVGTVTSGSSPILIGRAKGGTRFVNGRLDEVAIYQAVLTPAQIAAHYRLGSSVPTFATLQIAAVDPDNDALTFSATGLPPGLAIDAHSGVISGALAPTSTGAYQVSVTVSDGALSDTRTFAWTVTQPGRLDGQTPGSKTPGANRSPVLANPGSQTTVLLQTYAAVVGADNATAYWRLNDAAGGSARDSIGLVAGTVSGGVITGQPGALADADTAMLFDGATGYIQTTGAPTPSLAGDLTIELWMKVSLAARQTLVSKDPSREFELTLETNGELNFYQGNGVAGENIRSAVGAVSANTWQHVVVTRSAATNTIAFIVNGVPRGSGSTLRPATSGPSPVLIGRAKSGTRFVNGWLDEVAIYPVVLTPAQIAAHYRLSTEAFAPTDAALQLFAVDPDSDRLTFSATGLPAGLTIDAASGLISGAIAPTSTGVFQVSATVSDGALSDTRTFAWTVTWPARSDAQAVTAINGGVGGPPVLTNPGAQSSALVWNYAASVAADHAVAYWRLGDAAGGSARDSIGLLPGTLSGGVTAGQSGALADGDAAMLFNGGTGYIQSTGAPAVSLAGDLTIELWVNASLAARQTLVSKDPSREFELTLETNGELNFYQGNGAGSENVRSSGGAVTANTWQHLVITRSTAANTIAFFVNGVPRGSGSYVAAPVSGSSPILIGRAKSGTRFVNGLLDEVALYPIALTPAQAAAHFAMRGSAGLSGVTLQLSSLNPSGDPVVYSSVGLPPGLILNSATGLISGAPAGATAGTYNVTVTAAANSLSSSQTFTWTIY